MLGSVVYVVAGIVSGIFRCIFTFAFGTIYRSVTSYQVKKERQEIDQMLNKNDRYGEEW